MYIALRATKFGYFFCMQQKLVENSGAGRFVSSVVFQKINEEKKNQKKFKIINGYKYKKTV